MPFKGLLFGKSLASFQQGLSGFIQSASTLWFTVCFAEGSDACKEEAGVPLGQTEKFKGYTSLGS